MNPFAAIGLIAVGYGFTCYWLGRIRQLQYAGVFGIVLGVLALLPLGIDSWLFPEQVQKAGAHAVFADSAAIGFIAIGLATFTVGTTKLVVRIWQYFLGLIIIGLGLFNIFGTMYAPEFMESIGDAFVMPLSLGFAFVGIGAAMVLLILFKQLGSVVSGFARIGWLMVVSLILVQAATFGAWSQANARNRITSSDAFAARGIDLDTVLDQRLEAYINALYGFRGLFKASDAVNEGEFQAYYNSIDLATHYPGLRALSFISKVPEKDLPAFVAVHRNDKSLHPAGNPAFAITNKSNLPVHYIVTYSATSSAVGGNDLGSNPDRLAAFEKAEATGAPVSSGTLEFGGTNGQPVEKGFFITIPVTSKASGANAIGFVNAVFYYNEFFAHAFSPPSLLQNITLNITDTIDNTDIFASIKGGLPKQAEYSAAYHVPVADRAWHLHMFTLEGFDIVAPDHSAGRSTILGVAYSDFYTPGAVPAPRI
jgi:CHASE1-domain containing sensor protein